MSMPVCCTKYENDHVSTPLILSFDETLTFFPFVLEFYDWRDGLAMYRAYSDGHRELLEGSCSFYIEHIESLDGGKAWIESIPAELVNKARVYADLGVYMLKIAAMSDKARQLLSQRPILLYLVCERYPLDHEHVLSLCELGQRNILAYLGLASCRSALRFIDRIQSDFSTRSVVIVIHRLLDPETMTFKLFRHYKTITTLTLQVYLQWPTLTGTKLGFYLVKATQRERLKINQILSDVFQLGYRVLDVDSVRRIHAITSYDELKQLHDRWVIAQRTVKFVPDPSCDKAYDIPFAGNSNIVPIRNYQQLELEGVEQNHYVAIYHNRIIKGEYLVYKMHMPERVTIGLKRHYLANGRASEIYTVDQIQARNNRLPSYETLETVYSWLDSMKSVKPYIG
ncbi:PcfJ domain-containing protein [Photobacterium kishitanii]|uniref:PcfJ domain-containing protein n=1 Tax=Photobacterium kishitanii TaxID=318456 RepID=UPI001E54F260|nr:PcfJ domain-containing protein [Photobacterium kishitanii]